MDYSDINKMLYNLESPQTSNNNKNNNNSILLNKNNNNSTFTRDLLLNNNNMNNMNNMNNIQLINPQRDLMYKNTDNQDKNEYNKKIENYSFIKTKTFPKIQYEENSSK